MTCVKVIILVTRMLLKYWWNTQLPWSSSFSILIMYIL